MVGVLTIEVVGNLRKHIVSYFPRCVGWDVGDGALVEVDIEAEKVHVIHWFQFHGVAKEVRADESLEGDVGEKVLVEGDEAVVHVPVVGEVDLGVVHDGVMELLPGVLDEGDGGIAERRRELGSNPSPPYLLKIGSARSQMQVSSASATMVVMLLVSRVRCVAIVETDEHWKGKQIRR